jgi:hypothetical protein
MNDPGASSPLLFLTDGMEGEAARHPIILDHPGPEIIECSTVLPFASGRNQYTDAAQAANATWVTEIGLLEDDAPGLNAFDAGRFHELAGLVYRIEGFDELVIAANYITVLFVLDDLVDAADSLIGSHAGLMRSTTEFVKDCVLTGAVPANTIDDWPLPFEVRRKILAIGRAFADITRRLTELPEVPDLAFYFHEMREYLAGCIVQCEHRNTRMFNSLAEYEALRVKFSAVYACVELGALLRRLAPSQQARDFKPYRRMVRNTNLSVSYVNDLFSYKNDLHLGEVSNLILVLEAVDKLDRKRAFRRACHICDLVVLQYFHQKRMCSQLDKDAQAGMFLMENWMRGNFDWYISGTGRYVNVMLTHTPSGSIPR